MRLIRKNGFSSHFPNNGGDELSFLLRLSTGYEVAVSAIDAEEGLDHLALALLGEIFFKEAKIHGEKGGRLGVASTCRQEILTTNA